MVRVLSYNILVGGASRIEPLTKIIQSAQADIVGLVETTNPQVVEELARRLDMQCRMTGRGKSERDWQLAILSRLPIVDMQIHTRPDIFTRKYFLEVTIKDSTIGRITVFVVHLTSDFFKGSESNQVRRREVQEMLRIMSARQGTPHLLMGDMNSIAPHDTMKASILLRHMLKERKRYYTKRNALLAGQHKGGRRRPYLIERIIGGVLQIILGSNVLSTLLDVFSRRYAQGGIDLLLEEGYVDCFRRMHPHDLGYTCPAAAPAGRIDFIFASPELAQHLTLCTTITEGDGVPAEQASDHLPVLAEF